MLKTYMEITWRVNMKALVGVWFPIILINLFGRGQSHSPAPGGKLKQFYDFSDNAYNNSTLRCRYINQYFNLLGQLQEAGSMPPHNGCPWFWAPLSPPWACLLWHLAPLWLGHRAGELGWRECVGKFLLDRNLHKTSLRSPGLPGVKRWLTCHVYFCGVSEGLPLGPQLPFPLSDPQ